MMTAQRAAIAAEIERVNRLAEATRFAIRSMQADGTAAQAVAYLCRDLYQYQAQLASLAALTATH